MLALHWVDLNGDGKVDSITNNNNGTHSVSLSTGHSFKTEVWSGFGDNVKHAWVDLNGDGITDYVEPGNNGNFAVSLHSINYGNLIKLTEPSGKIRSIEYRSASKVTDAIKPDNTSYPNIANRSPRNLVTKLIDSDNLDLNSTSYSFEDGQVLMGTIERRVSLGFRKIFSICDSTGIETVTTYHQSEMLSGFPITVEKYFENNLMKSTHYEYVQNTTSIYGTDFVKIKSILENIYSAESINPVSWKKIELTYDNYGKIIKQDGVSSDD